MTRVRRIISSTMFIALMLAPVQPAIADEGPIRSGAISTAYASVAYASVAGGELGSCEAVPDCRAWLQSNCDPALTGRDPSLAASIEDVSRIADGRTPWLLKLETDCCRAEVMIQMWERDCTEIRSSRLYAGGCIGAFPDDDCRLTSIRIPASARWMTITANTPYIPWVAEALRPLTVNWSLWQPPPPRVVELTLQRHLWAVGTVVTDDRSCRAGARVVLQERSASGWIEIGTDFTDEHGAFELKLLDRPGRYRAVALSINSSGRTCYRSTSQIVQHHH